MPKTINFVGERRKKLDINQQKDKEVLKKVTYVLIGIFAVFLVTLGIRIYYVFQVREIREEQQTIRQVIASQQKTELDYNVFAQKLKQLTDLFGVRKDKQEAFEFFSRIFGPEVIISEIDYSSSANDILQFTIDTPSVFVMERVFEILRTDEVKNQFASVSKSELNRTATAGYSVKLTVTLATPGGPVAEDPNAPADNSTTPDVQLPDRQEVLPDDVNAILDASEEQGL